jgi:hypothetical protein
MVLYQNSCVNCLTLGTQFTKHKGMTFVTIFEKFERIETNQAAEGRQPCNVVKPS